MREHGFFSKTNRVGWVSTVGLILLTIVAAIVAFVWLPSAQADFRAQGLWDSICRAAGVPSKWIAGTERGQDAPTVSTNVVLLPAMAKPASSASVGRGATLALNCTMCHGALGMSRSDAPNLAGQYPEVIKKQMLDYQSGKRQSSIMAALAMSLTEENIADLAAYYASLPKARTAPTTYDEALPALVRVGDPMRNIAPCISCHGGVDQKLGAPWLEGMPKPYLVQQLEDFKHGRRKNDGQQQMRNVARPMTDEEIDSVATFYARKALPGHE
ncbi:c-type cytochrome [Janthinobacterium sp. HLX7-2]|uniref:c-type cytochrome n=1 Tax=Janthinobacterium sp. HLX7-2 TaxID=1259331 RepID=UPI003F20C934